MHTARFPVLAAIVFLAAACPAATGQGNTDIFLVRMVVEDAAVRFSVPANITNRPGADNHPAFLRDNTALLYTSHRNGQSDVFRFDIATGATTQLTDTPESEIDPRPGRTRGFFSAIRIEDDRKMRLWNFPLEGSETPTLLAPEIESAARHVWGFNEIVGLVVLGDTTTLQIANLSTGEVQVAEKQIAVTVSKIPQRRALSYVKQRDDDWFIEGYDISNEFSDREARPVEGQTEHVWMMDPASSLWMLMPKGPVIYAWEQTARTWKPVIDFSGSGVTSITRLAVSPDATLLAFAAERPAK